MKRIDKRNLGRMALNLLQILLGSLIAAASFRYLTYPNSIVSGGITGISQILNLLIGTPVGITSILFNIPLFLLAWKKLHQKSMRPCSGKRKKARRTAAA